MRSWIGLGIAVGSVALVGCTEKVDSTAIRTAGIYADFNAVADGSGDTELEMRLLVGGDDSNTYVELEGDDRLRVSVDGESTSVDKDRRVGNRVWYVAQASTDADDTMFEVAFTRGDDDDDAPSSTATLPPPFELSGPGSVSADEGGLFTWDADDTGDFRTEWDLDGDCIFDESGDSDDGELMIRPADIDVQDDEEACELRLTVDRIRNGSIDSAFGEGGSFEAIQRRRISFDLEL